MQIPSELETDIYFQQSSFEIEDGHIHGSYQLCYVWNILFSKDVDDKWNGFTFTFGHNRQWQHILFACF